MKREFLAIVLILTCTSDILYAQAPDSFFPSQVGNLWRYRYDSGPFTSWRITRDSTGADSTRFLFRIDDVGSEYLAFKVDTTANVYQYAGPDRWNHVYKLGAGSGEAWVWYNNGFRNFYAWVYATTAYPVFGTPTAVKAFRFGPFHPDSGGNSWYYREQHLASRFGMVFETGEPSYALFLTGCVINGDTFGIVVSVPELATQIPVSASLHPNYPNPFNPSTRIQFSIPRRTWAKLVVYDILGQEVQTLVEQVKEAGTYSVVWNTSTYSSGVYFCRLQTAEALLTRKMLLQK